MRFVVLISTILWAAQAQSPAGSTNHWPGAASLSGVLVDPSGKPLPDTEVTLFVAIQHGGKITYWPRGARATTNAQGEFLIEAIYPSTYHLIALPPAPSTVPTARRALARTFHPGVIDFAEASPLYFSPGQHISGYRMTVQTQPVYAVSGKLDADSNSPRDAVIASVQLVQDDHPFRNFALSGFFTQVNHLGGYHLYNVPPGSYTLALVSSNRPDWRTGSAHIEVTDADVEVPPIRLGPARELSGRFVLESATPAPLDWTKFDIYAESPGFTFGRYKTQIRPDGTFRQSPAVAVPANLTVEGPLPPRGYLASIRANGREILGQQVDVANLPAESLQVVIRTDPGTVRGSVADARKDRVLSVILFPVEPHLRKYPLAYHTNAFSPYPFQFDNVRPGDYFLVAVQRERTRDVFDDRFLNAGLERSAVRVHIGPNETKDFSLKVTPLAGDN